MDGRMGRPMMQKRPTIIRTKTTINKMEEAITKTQFDFPGLIDLYKGKVRDVYNIDDKLLVMVVSDRISAFDVVLPRGIP